MAFQEHLVRLFVHKVMFFSVAAAACILALLPTHVDAVSLDALLNTEQSIIVGALRFENFAFQFIPAGTVPPASRISGPQNIDVQGITSGENSGLRFSGFSVFAQSSPNTDPFFSGGTFVLDYDVTSIAQSGPMEQVAFSLSDNSLGQIVLDLTVSDVNHSLLASLGTVNPPPPHRSGSAQLGTAVQTLHARDRLFIQTGTSCSRGPGPITCAHSGLLGFLDTSFGPGSTVIPEPCTGIMLLTGILAMWRFRKSVGSR
jgi:hypothetical protein